MRLSYRATAGAVIVAAVAGAAVAPWAHAQPIRPGAAASLTPAAAKAAFGRFIQRRYPSARGYWTCPAAQDFGCLAEVGVAGKRHLISATARASGTAIVIVNVRDRSWVRRWSPYTKEVIRGFNSPGSASVNSPYFDWAFLAAQAHEAWQQQRKSFRAQAFDGRETGWQVFYDFGCKTRASLITCTNALGDSIRYGPTGEPGR